MKYYVMESIKNAQRVFPLQGRLGYHRYDMNENPEGLPKAFVDSVLQEITPEFLATYPEPDRFTEKYAERIGVKSENVLATNGSDMAIRYLLETFGEPGKDVVTVSPSFEMYRVNCSILGLRHVPVSYETDLTLDIEKLLGAIGPDTRVVVLLNPNNPIGNAYTDREFALVVQRAEAVGAVVIVDEAYHYFYPRTFLRAALERENVVVLRTFSKLFSLAACRLGVMIGHPDLIRLMRNGKLTFDVNAVALLFGERLLDRPELLEQLIRTEAEGRRYTLDVLAAHGYECRNCQGNYIFVRPRHDAHGLAERLRQEKQILVHTFGHPLLRDQIRVSTGSRAAMERFLCAFLALDAEDAP